VTVAFLTRPARGIPSEVALDQRDGMPLAGGLTLDDLQTGPKAHLTHRITSLSPARMDQVCRARAAATGC